jgi:hypothetical protein
MRLLTNRKAVLLIELETERLRAVARELLGLPPEEHEQLSM